MKLKNSVFIVILLLLLPIIFPVPVYGMHIMEGHLPPFWCISWGLIAIPFVFVGFLQLNEKVKQSPKSLILFALCGAFAFVLSACKIPTITGSSSHPTGIGFGAVLFGSFPMVLISGIILLFQAVLLAHGGITTLGANLVSMGIVGPLCAVGAYRLVQKVFNKKELSFFMAAFIGDLATYLMTAFQLALAYPEDTHVFPAFCKFVAIFAVTQIPIAIAEGFMTVFLLGVLEKYGPRELGCVNEK